MDHLEVVGMTNEETDVVMAPHSYREVNRIRGGSFNSPEDWAEAIRDAQEREQEYYAHLTELGFPDTAGMSPRDGHMTRIAYLMTKYPQADWDLLLTGQEEAMEWKPSPRPKPVPVTIQYIEKQKLRFLGRLLHRDELVRDGDKDGTLPLVLRSYLRIKEFLERHGVDTQELAKSKHTLEYFNHPLIDSIPKSTPVDASADEGKTVEGTEQSSSVIEEDISPAEPASEDPLTMTAREASTLLGLTYQTVIRCLANGDLPYGKKVGRNWIITREPFMAWLDSNTDTVRSMTSQAGEKPGRKNKASEPSTVLPMSTRGRTPSF